MPLKITVNMLALPGASEALWIQTLSQTAQQFHTPTFRGKLNHEVYPLSHPIPTEYYWLVNSYYGLHLTYPQQTSYYNPLVHNQQASLVSVLNHHKTTSTIKTTIESP